MTGNGDKDRGKKNDERERKSPVKTEVELDPRIFAYRRDLAAQSLYGRVNAPRYVAGTKRQVRWPAVALRRRPEASAPLETEALFGEHVTVYDTKEGWAWLQLQRDQYVGYAPLDALMSPAKEPTHWVSAVGTFLFPVADIKSPPMMHLSIASQLTIADYDERFSRLKDGGFVATRHISEIGRFAKDYVEVAERLIGTPYLWGGRTRVGIDCSGLVQTALQAAGIDVPRDSDMQQRQIGDDIEIHDKLDGLQRGDLIFWKGHVGIMADGIMMVHANAHHMTTVIEPLPEAAQRISKDAGPISAIKRMPAPGA